MNERDSKGQYSDEISLYELLLLLKKRFKYILAVFILGIFAGGLVAFFLPDIYRARATLWVDFLFTQSLLENLKSNETKTAGKLSFIIPLQQGRFQEMNNMSISILNSLEFKKKVLDRIKGSYSDRDYLGTLEKAVNEGKGEKLFRAEVDKKTGSLNLISEQPDRKLAEDILRFAIEEFEKDLSRAVQDYEVAFSPNKEKTAGSKYFVLSIIEKPNSLEYPVKPKRKLILGVSAIGALFSGIFLAFLVEWLSNVKRRED